MFPLGSNIVPIPDTTMMLQILMINEKYSILVGNVSRETEDWIGMEIELPLVVVPTGQCEEICTSIAEALLCL